MFNGNRDYCYNYQHYRNGIRQGVNYERDVNNSTIKYRTICK
jgi:hypothetical protein